MEAEIGITQSTSSGSPAADGRDRGPVTTRLLAFLVDAILLTAIMFLAAAALGAVRDPVISFVSEPGHDTGIVVHRGRWLAAAAIDAAISAAYFIGSWTLSPATPGQRWLRLYVVRTGGRDRLGMGRAALRWLVLMGPVSLGALAGALWPVSRPVFVWGAPFWYVLLLASTAWSRSGRGWHDLVSGSSVTGGQRVLAEA